MNTFSISVRCAITEKFLKTFNIERISEYLSYLLLIFLFLKSFKNTFNIDQNF
jgi:hypothetical protein